MGTYFNTESGKWELEKTKSGLPARNDVIGRFKAGMSGVSGNFRTDGMSIWSYDEILAKRNYHSPDEILFTDYMWGAPYGPTTAGHMREVYNGLRDLAANRNDFPKRLQESLAKSLLSSAENGIAASEAENRVRSQTNYYMAAPWQTIIAQSLVLLKERQKELLSISDYVRARYSRESIKAYRESIPAFIASIRAFLDAYAARILSTSYPPPRMPRLVIALPVQLVPKDYSLAGTKDGKILGWHFRYGATLANGDKREVKIGEPLSIFDSDPVRICNRGMHASVRISDAFGYNNGPYLTRVVCEGDMQFHHDKLAARTRTVIGSLHLFDYPAIELLLKEGEGEKAERECLKIMGLKRRDTRPVVQEEV